MTPEQAKQIEADLGRSRDALVGLASQLEPDPLRCTVALMAAAAGCAAQMSRHQLKGYLRLAARHTAEIAEFLRAADSAE